MAIPPKQNNRDQDLPKRQGDDVPPAPDTTPGSSGRERNAPVPEEETYERDPAEQRRSPGVE
jgi:hypothetical protein